jgi:hypothetical protein
MELYAKTTELIYQRPEDLDGRIGHDQQTIQINTHDGGAGDYVVISTERWAINNRAEAHQMVDELFDALGIDNGAPEVVLLPVKPTTSLLAAITDAGPSPRAVYDALVMSLKFHAAVDGMPVPHWLVDWKVGDRVRAVQAYGDLTKGHIYTLDEAGGELVVRVYGCMYTLGELEGVVEWVGRGGEV